MENAPLKGAKIKLILISTVLLSLVFANQAVFADANLSISVTSDTVTLETVPEIFTSGSQTITVSTTSTTGYIVNLSTLGSSSTLLNQSDSSVTIPTFTLPSGSSSVPAISTGYGYGYSIDDGNNYISIPEPGQNNQIFDASSSGEQQHTLTFGALVSTEQQKGTYTNTLEIRAIARPLPCSAGYICYYGNGDDETGAMSDQPAGSNTDITLIPSNFSRPGYGFAGWNTKMDGSGTNYGPNETITTGDLSTGGLQLYARWVQSSGNLQGWHGCSSLGQENIIALTDTRDGNTYAVTKYADNQCWMMENLRLDLSDEDLEISGLNTNNPTAAFTNAVDNSDLSPSDSFCTGNNKASCVNQILFNTSNIDRSLTASYDTNSAPRSWYSYGNYYNWYTATTGNGTFSISTGGASAEGDICPAGWKLPTGYGGTGNLAKLDIAKGGNGENATSGSNAGLVASKRWRTYPLNFIYSGEQKDGTNTNRAISGSYATSNTANSERATNLWLKADGVYMNSNNTYKIRGQTVRCIINEGYAEIGNIHYEPNYEVDPPEETGTMEDDINVDLGTAVAAANGFNNKPHSEFVGWNTAADGTGVVVAVGGSVAAAANHMGIVEGGTLTLYATWRSVYSLVYDGNNADAGSMSSANVSQLEIGNQDLIASNFSRAGYGFAGWSLDSDAGTKLLNNTPVTVYGPNARISVDNTFLSNADPVTNQVTLYAVWLPENSTYTMQSFGTTECGNMSIGDVLALKDTRDNNVYAVTKLNDNKCWMMENLRLDLSDQNLEISSLNTNNPTAAFVSAANQSPRPSSDNTLCKNDDSACVDKIGFNTNAINRNLSPSYSSNAVNSSWYSYGVMYSWYTATAGNGTFAMASGNVVGDICPSGWRLPTGGSSGEYVNLNNLENSGLENNGSGLVKFPLNFNYSGDYNNTKPGGRNSYGRYWSGTPNGNNNAYRFGFSSNISTPSGSYNKWDAFAVRCIAK